MAPGYRTDPRARRGNRSGFPEQDDFEGLPVRQWREEWVNIAPPPPPVPVKQNDRFAIEFPHGLPRDFGLLQPHTQELLRAARSGKLTKRPAPPEDDDADADAAPGGDKAEKKDDPSAAGYRVKIWKQIPRNAEGATVGHLAKRHKGTIRLTPKALLSDMSGPTVTRAIVRKVDAAGNSYDQTITLTEGQPIDGQIISTTVVPAAALAANDLASQQSTPARRKPPVSKKKPKGPGRGRKKKGWPSISNPEHINKQPTGPAAPVEGAPSSATATGDNAAPAAAQDVEMVDQSGVASDDDDDDDDDGDDGDEGEGGADDEQKQEAPNGKVEEDKDQEMKDVPSISAPAAEAPTESAPEPASTAPPIPASASDASPSPAPKRTFPVNPLNLSAPPIAQPQGSPLRNVILPSPTDPSPVLSPTTSKAPLSARSDRGIMDTLPSLRGGGALPSLRDGMSSHRPPREPLSFAAPPPPVLKEPKETHETKVPKEPPVEVVVPPVPAPEPTTDAPVPVEPKVEPQPEAAPAPSLAPPQEVIQEATPQPPASPPLPPTTVVEDEDDGPDLLGGLEAELDRQADADVKDQASAPSELRGGVDSAIAPPVTEEAQPQQPKPDQKQPSSDVPPAADTAPAPAPAEAQAEPEP